MGVEESGLTGMPHSCLSFRLTSAIATDGDGEMSGERRKQRTSGPLLMEKMKDGRSGRLLQVLEEDKKVSQLSGLNQAKSFTSAALR